MPLSAVRPEVPSELDALCAQTFSASGGGPDEWTATVPGDGPRTPADVVGAIEPWGEVSVVAALPSFVQPAAAATGGVSRQSVRSAFDGSVAAPPGTPPPAPPVRRPSTGRIHRVGAVPGSAGPAAGYAAAGLATGATAVVATQPGAATGAPVPPPPPAYDPAAAATAQYASAPPAPSTGAQPAVGDPGAPSRPWSEPKPARRGPRRFNATPFVLVFALGLVGYGVYWAVNTAFDDFRPAVQTGEQQPSGEGSAPAAEGGTATEGAEEAPAPAPEVRPVIASGAALDPEGDESPDNEGEHPELVPRAFDQQPETSWISRRYNAADFAGLRSGIGFAILLEEKAPVSTIVIDTPVNGGNVEIRSTSPDTPTEGEVLASGALSPGVEFTFETPVETDSIVLWFTELPQNPSGEFRAEINELLVS
jgi:hypothetical protein